MILRIELRFQNQCNNHYTIPASLSLSCFLFWKRLDPYILKKRNGSICQRGVNL